ncbi:dTDP-4-dehydrorhamnose 3,5-epimerase [Candidatus Peregrinibacteria bacterium]|nr:dTDP-4-dehydrorhamnose 3,5-epimerase [Candidatus Peregrinibacteria bacterium]
MTITESSLPGLYICQPKVVGDARGFFQEVFRFDEMEKAGLALPTFVQMNHSRSAAGVVRGLHFQYDKPLGKLIRVPRGKAHMVAVDIRKKSKTLGKHLIIEVSEENCTVLYVPPGFATGFCVSEGSADVEYLYTALYNPVGESNILWNDPAIGIHWPVANPTLSERDKKAGTLADWLARPEANTF